MSDRSAIEEERFMSWVQTKTAPVLMSLVWGDAAVRMSDTANLAVVNGYAGFWLAFSLSDGKSDEIAYATKADAINHQLHEQQCVYVKLPPDGMTPRHAKSYLDSHRKLYDAGMRIVDPDQPRLGVIRPL